MGGRFTISKASLAENCVYAFTSKAPDWPRVTRHLDVRINNAFHRAAARTINTPSLASGPNTVIDEACQHCGMDTDSEKIKLRNMKPVQHAQNFQLAFPITANAEIAIAYNYKTRTSRHLGLDIDRNYVLTPDEIAGTIDCAGTTQDPELGFLLEVNDWKTGPMARQTVNPLPGNRQIESLGMILTKTMTGIDTIRLALSFIGSDGGIFRDEYLADPGSDMDEAESFLLDVIARIERNEQPRPGLHCTNLYCPLLGVCPETQAALATIDTVTPIEVGERPAMDQQGNAMSFVVLNSSMIQNDEHCIWAFHRARAARNVAEQIIDACKSYVSALPGEGIVMPNGKTFGPGRVNTPKVEARGPEEIAKLLDALSQEVTRPTAMKILVGVVTAESLHDALASNQAYKTTIEKLRKAGFVRDESKIEYRERKTR